MSPLAKRFGIQTVTQIWKLGRVYSFNYDGCPQLLYHAALHCFIEGVITHVGCPPCLWATRFCITIPHLSKSQFYPQFLAAIEALLLISMITATCFPIIKHYQLGSIYFKFLSCPDSNSVTLISIARQEVS